MKTTLSIFLLSIAFTSILMFSSQASAQTCGEMDYSCQLKIAMQKLRDNPKEPENYYTAALIYQNSGNCPEAVEVFTMYIAIGVTDPVKMADAYNNRGICQKRLKKYTEALADYSKAIGYSSKDAKLYVNRGNAYRDSGDGAKALADFSMAISVNPQYASAYVSRGHIYLTTGEIEKALADFNKGVEVDPNEPESYYNRGVLYFQGKKMQQRLCPTSIVILHSAPQHRAGCLTGL